MSVRQISDRAFRRDLGGADENRRIVHSYTYGIGFSGNHYRLRRQRVENFVDIVKAGKESYYIVSKFEFFEYAKVAPLFGRLSQDFERCVYGLNMVKNDLQELRHPIVQKTKQILM